MLAAKLIACQRLVWVWPCAEKRQGSAYSARVQCCNSQNQTDKGKKGQNCIYRLTEMWDITSGRKPSAFSHLSKSVSLNSCSQRTSSLHRHHSGQQTVRPLNADSSPGKLLLNHGTQRQTRRHKTVYAKGVARNKWYNAPRGSTTQRAMEQRTI